MILRVAAALLSLAVLAGCSGASDDAGDTDAGGGSPTTSPTSSAPTSTATTPSAEDLAAVERICSALTPAQRRSLVGAPVNERDPEPTRSRCSWSSLEGESRVMVIAMTGSEWAAALPGVIQQLRDLPSTTPQDLAELAEMQEALAGVDALDDDRACSYFATVARIGGARQRQQTSVNFLAAGTYTPHPGVTAQRCRDGYFSSVTGYGPGLVRSDALARRAVAALDLATARLRAS